MTLEIARHFILINKLIVFLINAIGIEVALWVYVTNRRQKANQVFFLFTLILLLWVDFDFLGTFAPYLFSDFSIQEVSYIVLWSVRALFAVLSLFFVFIYYFSLYYKGKETKRKILNLGVYGTWALVFALSFTEMIIRSVEINLEDGSTSRIIGGSLFFIYPLVALLTLFFSLRVLLEKYRLFKDSQKRKTFYLLVGVALFGFFNIIFNVLIPVCYNASLGPLTLFGNYVVIIILAFTAYYVIKEQLFGIKVILVEILIGLMGAMLAVMPFLVDVFWQKMMLFSLFFLFCIFSYLLVKSTVQEYKEKELLGQKVLERTKELEEIKKHLEEMNTVLEIRVKARTMELERLNQTLEEKVRERTNDLQEKILDLEKFQRLTVGRELKMIELKKEIEELKGRVVQPKDEKTEKDKKSEKDNDKGDF